VRIVSALVITALAVSRPAIAQPPGTPAAPAQVATPTDVQPGSINNEDVPYPYPVSYLPFVSYWRTDVRMASWTCRRRRQTAARLFCCAG
jgi:hypothetical protein